MSPITSKINGYLFEVAIPGDLPVSGVVLLDQVKSLDWNVRKASFACRAPDDEIRDALDKILRLIGP